VKITRTIVTCLLLALCLGCGETGREQVELALSATGTPARTLEREGARVTLTRADIAFGPAYFCASYSGTAELCSVAIAELREVVLLRGLDPAAQPLGVLRATTGTIHSAIYDYGISWLLTQTAARPSSVAPEGHSAILEGTIERAGRVLRFRAQVDVQPAKRGELSVNTQRTEHEVVGDGEALTLRVDPSAWVDRLEIEPLFALDGDGDGLVQIEPGTTSYESILQGMLNRTPVGFGW
jgi:hypothetical protein